MSRELWNLRAHLQPKSSSRLVRLCVARLTRAAGTVVGETWAMSAVPIIPWNMGALSLYRHSTSIAQFTRAAGTVVNTRLLLRQWWPCRFHQETP